MDFVPWRVCRTILADLADNTVLRQRYSAGSIRPGVLVGVLAAIPCRFQTPCRFALTYQKPQKPWPWLLGAELPQIVDFRPPVLREWNPASENGNRRSLWC